MTAHAEGAVAACLRQGKSNMAAQRPIFIGGMYRSGTSLLRAMLGQHPQLFSGFETGWCLPGKFEAPQSWFDLLSGLFDVSPEYLNGLYARASRVEEFVDAFMSDQAERSGKPRWIEKTPLNGANILRILDYWPTAKFIHIVRHPMDVYASCVFSGKWGSADEFSSRWMSTCGEATRTIKRAAFAPGSVHDMRYETLIAQPEIEMRAVCDFVDAPWNPAVAVFAGTDKEAIKLRSVLGRQSSTAERMREPLNAGRIGIRRQLSADERAEFHLATKRIAERGYGEEFGIVCQAYESAPGAFANV